MNPMNKKKNRSGRIITRRDFIRGATYGTLGLTLGMHRLTGFSQEAKKEVLFSAKNPQAEVVLIRHQGVVDSNGKINEQILADMLDQALMKFSGEINLQAAWGKYFKSDDIVGIKYTRCSWMRVYTEEQLTDLIQKKLSDNGIARKRIHADDYGLPIDKCSALLNVPSVKVHTLTGIAASIKNYINFIDNPSAYHHQNSAKLGEIWLKPHVKGKTRLIIVDLLRPYFGPGPQINPMHRWHYNGILIGTDPVAIDTICTRICQLKRNLFKGEEWIISPPPLSIAAADSEYKLGTSDPAKIKLIRLGWEQDILI
jgi:hypothetical protein